MKATGSPRAARRATVGGDLGRNVGTGKFYHRSQPEMGGLGV